MVRFIADNNAIAVVPLQLIPFIRKRLLGSYDSVRQTVQPTVYCRKFMTSSHLDITRVLA